MSQREIDWGQVPTNLLEGFEQFHSDNPHVYRSLVDLTREGKESGRKRLGIAMLFNVLRWNRMLATQGEPFKLNNNYQPFYSRLIEERNPDCRGIFSKRKALADY